MKRVLHNVRPHIFMYVELLVVKFRNCDSGYLLLPILAMAK